MMDQRKYAIHLDPLQGYTDRVYRNAFARYFGGVEVFYTPFIRIENGEVRRRDLRDLQMDRNTVPCLIPQILPGNADEFQFLVDTILKEGYRAVDVNLGCPFPMIARKGKGAGMLPFPDRVQALLTPMEAYPEIRFSLKMRLGWENTRECLELIDLINALPLRQVTLHARTGVQQYKGFPDEEAFQAFYELCKPPLFYNGDISTLPDIQRIVGRFPALGGIMIGRGLLASPLLTKEFVENETFSLEKRMSLYRDFHRELFAAYSEILQGDCQLLAKMKALWEYFLPDTDRKCLKKIRKATKVTSYMETVKQIFYAT